MTLHIPTTGIPASHTLYQSRCGSPTHHRVHGGALTGSWPFDIAGGGFLLEILRAANAMSLGKEVRQWLVIIWTELAPLDVVANVLNDFVVLEPAGGRLVVLKAHIQVPHGVSAHSFAAWAFVLALAQTLLVEG